MQSNLGRAADRLLFMAEPVERVISGSLPLSAAQIAAIGLILACFATLGWMIVFRPRLLTKIARWARQWLGLALLVVGGLLLPLALVVSLGQKSDGPAAGVEGAATNSTDSIFSALYTTAQFFVLNASPSTYERHSPTLSALVALLAAVLFVLVAIQGIALLFRDSLDILRLRMTWNHVVVCGVGRIGRQLVQDLVANPKEFRRVVVIDIDTEHPDLTWLRENGALVIHGPAQRGDVLDEARIATASEVFVVTGSDEINVECVVEIRHRLTKRSSKRSPLRCHVHVRDRDLANGIRARLDREGGNVQPRIDVEIFNSTERTVRRLFQDGIGPERLPSKQGEVAHVVIIGFGDFGQELAERLATLGHFANLARLRMTIIDHDLEKKAKAFLARYPRFTRRDPFAPTGEVVVPWWRLSDRAHDRRCLDAWEYGSDPGISHVCNADFLELEDVEEDVLVRKLAERFKPAGVKPLVFVCFDAADMNFTYAERLCELRNRLDPKQFPPAPSIESGAAGGPLWPVFVWIPDQSELSGVLGKNPSDPIPFGACFGTVSYEEVTASWADELARFLKFGYTARFPDEGLNKDDVRAQWRACAETVKGMPFSGLGTPGTCTWQDHVNAARHWWNQEKREAFRTSDRAAAIHAVVKLAFLGFRIDPATGGGSDALREMVMAAKDIIPVTYPPHDEQMRDDSEHAGDAADSVSQSDRERLQILPRMEHYRWSAERLMAGWRYAPLPAEGPQQSQEKASLKRQFRHWDLVPFDVLPQNEKAKDNYSVQVLLALAAHADGLLKVAPFPQASAPASRGAES